MKILSMTILSMKILYENPIFEKFYLWKSCLWKILSMKILSMKNPIYEKPIYEKSYLWKASSWFCDLWHEKMISCSTWQLCFVDGFIYIYIYQPDSCVLLMGISSKKNKSQEPNSNVNWQIHIDQNKQKQNISEKSFKM